MTLDLEDFSPLLDTERKLESLARDLKKKGGEDKENLEIELKRIRKEYEKEILNLQRKFKQELDKVRDEAYRRGFEEGYSKGLKEQEERYSREIANLKSVHSKEIASLSEKLENSLKLLENSFNERLVKLVNSIASSLEEALEFLYIHPKNAEYLKSKLEEILHEFKEEELISLEVGSQLYKYCAGLERVKENPNLGECDFKVKFKDFTLESSFREKLELLRDEFKREAEKITKV